MARESLNTFFKHRKIVFSASFLQHKWRKLYIYTFKPYEWIYWHQTKPITGGNLTSILTLPLIMFD